MRCMSTAFFDGEITAEELFAAYDLAAEVRAAVARGEDRLPNGLHIAHFTGVADESGNVTRDPDESEN